MSANWDVSFETREQDKNLQPQNIFVALLMGEGGIGHSTHSSVGVDCVGGDTEQGEVQIDRASWGFCHAVPAPRKAHPCFPCTTVNPSVLALQSKLCGQKSQAVSPPCPLPPCEAALLSQLQVLNWPPALQSVPAHPNLPGPASSPLLRSASPPALSSPPSLPPARWSHYRTQLLLHAESW